MFVPCLEKTQLSTADRTHGGSENREAVAPLYLEDSSPMKAMPIGNASSTGVEYRTTPRDR